MERGQSVGTGHRDEGDTCADGAMRIQWVVDRQDTERVAEFVVSQRGRSFAQHRIRKNVRGPVPSFHREVFWQAMVSCLLTTQQRSGPESAVTRFICTEPFPLDLQTCVQQPEVDDYVERIVTDFGGLRRARRIGEEVRACLVWLEGQGGWLEIECEANALAECRRCRPQGSDKLAERAAAKLVAENLKGFGPKQSRNLWQTLDFTRYEIPLDSRITKWLNGIGFPVKLSASGLADANYYDFVMDGVQELCAAGGVLPCVLDAAIFAGFDTDWPAETLIW